MAPEPAHLVGVDKACPRPGCRSLNVKWRYFENGKKSQPRYECLKCKKYFTFGGRIYRPKEKKDKKKDEEKAVQREVAVVAGALAARTKITSSATSSTSTLRDEQPKPRFVMDLRPKTSTSSRTDQSLLLVSQSATVRGKGKRSMKLQGTPAAGLQKQVEEDKEIDDMEPIVELDRYGAGSLWPNFEVDLCTGSILEEMHGSEFAAWEPELELTEPVAAGAAVDEIEALVDRGPAFRLVAEANSEMRRIMSMELLESEKPVQMFDARLLSL